MPKLKNIPEILGGYDPSSGYVAIPPMDPASDVGAAFVAGKKWAREIVALQDFNSFASVAQGVIANQAQRVGVMPWVVDSLKTVFAEIPLVDGASVVDGAVRGIAESVSEQMADCATAVPIVGAIVKLGVSLAQIIRGQVADEQAGKPRPPIAVAPMVYDYADDMGQGLQLDGLRGAADWTDAFMPRSSDPEFRATRLEGNNNSVRWASEAGDGLGLLPAIADQLGVYQTITLGPPGTTGDYLPSGRKFSAMLWQSAMFPSVQMFLIDSHKIESAWVGWFDALWKFSYSDFAALDFNDFELQLFRARIQQSASYSKLYECEGAGKPDKIVDCRGKAPVFKPESVIKNYPRSKLAKKLGGEKKLTGLYADIVRYDCIVHRERAAWALRTLLVAYVPSDSPLLLADPVLAALHREMRQLLLTHNARYQVEMDLVPDGKSDGTAAQRADREFKVELERTRILSTDAIAAMNFDLAIKAGKGRLSYTPIPVFLAELTPPPEAPGIGLPESVDPPSGGDGGMGWFAALVGAAAVAGGIALARRGRRR